MIRILLVDDSAIVRAILRQISNKFPRIEICGEATNGLQAIEQVKQLKPDAIIMDIIMPIMDGLEATKKISLFSDTPIIIFSTEDTNTISFEALQSGATEIIQKPDFSQMSNEAINRLFKKIIVIAEEKQNKKAIKQNFLQNKSHFLTNQTKLNDFHSRKDYTAIIIGTSTGGPQALLEILSNLPENFPIPIIITQHIDKSFDKSFAQWLNSHTKLSVQLVEKTVHALPHNVYIAPADYHLVFNSMTKADEIVLSLSSAEPLHFLRPSVDVLFISAVETLKEHCIAVLLTGMGSDGAEGMKKIKEKGGYTIAESKETATIFGMPRSAIELGAVCNILPLPAITQELCTCCKISPTKTLINNTNKQGEILDE